MSAPTNVPYPLLFGPSFPDLRLVMKGGKQRVESRTNRNLWLAESAFDENGTYRMSQLLGTLPNCSACGHNPDHRCSLVCVPESVSDDPDDWRYWTPPDFANCPGYTLLESLCATEPQKKFLRSFSAALIPRNLTSIYGRVKNEVLQTFGGPADHRQLLERTLVDLQFSFPALIPETWLNAIGADRTTEDEEHLEENPQRVDFVMFAKGRKCVIEIDGKSHYADYTKSTGWVVSERRYTRNLRIDRALRRQGWEIYRFSDLEIRETTESDFLQLITHLPGVSGYPYIPSDAIQPAVAAAIDIPF